MFKWIAAMFKWIAKKYCVSLVNDCIAHLNSKVDIEKYRSKILSILNVLNSLLAFLDDKQISADEADIIVEQTKQLF